MIFLDNFTKTRPSHKVLEKLHKLQKEHWLPHITPYKSNAPLYKELNSAIETLYASIGASETDFFFPTSSEEEGLYFVKEQILLQKMTETGKNFLLTLSTERASILKGVQSLEGIGAEVLMLPVDQEGRLTKEILEAHYTPRALFLALSWVHPLTGVVQPMAEIAEYCKEKGIFLYIEASEALSRLFFRFQDLPIDAITFSGDPMHAPFGTGALFIKGDLFGNKKGKLPLSEIKNPAHLIALGEAVYEMQSTMDMAAMEMARFRSLFEERLKSAIPRVVFFGEGALRVPSTTAFAISGIHAELLLFHLRDKGIYLTHGGGKHQRLSYVLQAMHVDRALSYTALSLTMSRETTEEEIEKAASLIIKTVKELESLIEVEVTEE